jgi:hypothetical protein
LQVPRANEEKSMEMDEETQVWIFESSFADNGNNTTTYEVDRVG